MNHLGAAAEQHTAIVGKTGSGKSYLARGEVETFLEAGRQTVVIDPTSVWWGLRSSADGNGPGFPVVVFGGEHADVPIDDSAGAALAETIVERGISCVVDVGDFLMGERRRFLTPFLAHLYQRNRRPLHLIIDEADEVAPQKPLPEQTLMLHHADRIVRRGRSRGFRVMMITQRPAVLHKDVLSQAATLVAMKLTSPQDRDAIKAWIEGQADRDRGKEILASLPRLQLGEGWVWCPELEILERRHFPKIKTLDTSAAPTTDDDQVRTGPVLAPVDVAELVSIFAPKQEAEAGKRGILDPTYQRGFADGKLQAEQYAEQRGYDRGRLEWAEERRTLLAAMQAALGYLAPYAREEGGMQIVDVQRPPAPPVIEGEYPAPTQFRSVPGPLVPGCRIGSCQRHGECMYSPCRAVPRPAPDPPPPSAIRDRLLNGGDRRGGGELRILRVLVEHHPKRLTPQQWATLAGMSRNGGTWRTYVSRLRTAGLLDEGSDGTVTASSSGSVVAGFVQKVPRSSAAVREMWRRSLGKGPGRLMDILSRHADGLTADTLARAAEMEPTGGTFRTYLSRLRSNGLVDGKDRLRLAAELI